MELQLILFTISLLGSNAEQFLSEAEIYDRLLKNYNKYTRPVKDARKSVDVQIKLTLLQIVDVNEKQQILATKVWLEQTWYDEYLRWNNTANIPYLVVQSNEIWTPDVIIANALGGTEDTVQLASGKSDTMWVFETGRVMRLSSLYVRTFCPMDMTRFPFDEQTCGIIIGSWAYIPSQVDVVLKNESTEIINWHGPVSKQWNIVNFTSEIKLLMYGSYKYKTIYFTLEMHRKSLFYITHLFVPCYLISMLSSSSFVLPPDGGDRLSLGVTTFLSFTIFGLVVVDNVPEESDDIPLFSEFLLCAMTLNLLGILWTTVVINVFNLPVIKREISPKLVHFMEKVTLSKLRNRKTPLQRSSDDVNEEEKKDNVENANQEPPEHRNSANNFDMLKPMKNEDSSECVNYTREWRFVLRAIDKLLFVINAFFLTCSMLFIIFINYR